MARALQHDAGKRHFLAVFALAAFFAFAAGALAREAAPNAIPEVAVAELPKEARATLVLIKLGGPFPYRRDGATFGNFEKRLPTRARGYYHEYTVPTPGVQDRGARRVVAGEGAGGDVRTSGEYYYTDDHYRTFRRIRE